MKEFEGPPFSHPCKVTFFCPPSGLLAPGQIYIDGVVEALRIHNNNTIINPGPIKYLIPRQKKTLSRGFHNTLHSGEKKRGF